MDHVVSESCYKGTSLQRNYTYNTFVKVHANDGKKNGSHIMTMTPCYIYVLMRCIIKGLHFNLYIVRT